MLWGARSFPGRKEEIQVKNNTTKSRVVLTSYDCGEMTEDDFDQWVGYATGYLEREAKACGFDLTVESDNFGTAGGNRVTCDGDDFAEASIREQIQIAWNEWCAEGAAS